MVVRIRHIYSILNLNRYKNIDGLLVREVLNVVFTYYSRYTHPQWVIEQ